MREGAARGAGGELADRPWLGHHVAEACGATCPQRSASKGPGSEVDNDICTAVVKARRRAFGGTKSFPGRPCGNAGTELFVPHQRGRSGYADW